MFNICVKGHTDSNWQHADAIVTEWHHGIKSCFKLMCRILMY